MCDWSIQGCRETADFMADVAVRRVHSVGNHRMLLYAVADIRCENDSEIYLSIPVRVIRRQGGERWRGDALSGDMGTTGGNRRHRSDDDSTAETYDGTVFLVPCRDDDEYHHDGDFLVRACRVQ